MTAFNHAGWLHGHQPVARFAFLLLLALLLFVQPVPARDGESPVCAGITEPVFDVMLSFPVPGILTAQKFKEGEFVKAGEIILELDSRLEELEVERYRLIMENKKTDWESTKTVFDKTSSVSRDELLKKEADYRVAVAEHQIAVEQLRRRRLGSPADGIIAEIKLHAGEACAAYQPVARVVDTRRCYFVSNLEARDAARFKLGQSVDLEFEDGPASVKVKGKIAFVSPVVDAASGLQKIKAVLDNESGKIRPGLAGKMSPRTSTCTAVINEPTRNRPQRNLALAELARLRHFAGPARDFWPLFLAAAGQLTGVDKLTLLVRKPGGVWQRTLDWPAQSLPSRMLTHYLAQLDGLASQAAGENIIVQPLEPAAGVTARHFAIAARVGLSQSPEECALAAMISEVTEAEAGETALCLALAAPTVESFQTNATARQAKADVEKFASVLDLTASMSGEERFLATALTLCNGLAAQFHCERASLGWLDRGYIRLRAISRTEKFDPHVAAARALEIAMEEAFDQDNEILWPPGDGATVIVRDHEQFAKEQGAGHVCSLPLRRKGGPIAVVTCERLATSFSETELKQMRLACDLATPRLADLRLKDLWFGARWAAQMRRGCAKVLGPEHTWAKVLSLLTVVVLAVVCFLRLPYRVEGDFQLRSDELAYLAAPFDGYIDQVYFRPGDHVTPGVPLVKLKTAELELDEAMASADWNRYQREAEKARAAKALAEMRIFDAMAEQAKARLDLTRYRLGQASIQAPFSGVIVEGDLRERIGSPVKTADVLLKVARTDKLYVEAEVNERDIHEILNGKNGEMAFVSRPREKFPVTIITIEQAAVPKEQANVFLVRCALPQGAQPWWRPGMSGVCKFDAGKRTLLWILTHRTVDFLRMKLWW